MANSQTMVWSSNGKARNCGKVGFAMAREPTRFLGRLRSCLNI